MPISICIYIHRYVFVFVYIISSWKNISANVRGCKGHCQMIALKQWPKTKHRASYLVVSSTHQGSTWFRRL